MNQRIAGKAIFPGNGVSQLNELLLEDARQAGGDLLERCMALPIWGIGHSCLEIELQQ